ncbi:MAG: carboxypeptidase-like regulatory domain-containing protein [Phocaeicola sp.]|uniref:carboxypeptidase-like regulatory domain-containing protein n=1 Tax=Phocaeicola sp. TaxID=2773926 RepID=UPI003FA0DA8D
MKRGLFTCLSITSFFLSTLFLSGCKKENDIIDRPSPASITIKGKVYTANGQPLSNVKVTLDYSESAYLVPMPLKTKHKAECTTDVNGRYKFCFEKRDDEILQEESDMTIRKDYILSFDVSKLKSTDYVMPSDVNGGEPDEMINYTYQTGDLAKSGNYDKNIYIPKKRWIDVSVQSVNLLSSKDVYGINNTISYGDGDISVMTPVTLQEGVCGPFKILCAVNDSNRISLQCLRGGSGAYEPVSSVERFKANNSDPADICLFNSYLSSDTRFRLYMTSESAKDAAPFRMVQFYASDIGKQNDKDPLHLDFPLSFAYYDSIVWGAKGYPDTETVYSKVQGREKRLLSWGNYFFGNKPLYTYLYGYKNGRIAYTDSLLTDIKPKDFLGHDWNDRVGEREQTYTVYHSQLLKGVNFRYEPLLQADGHLYSTVTLNMPNGTEDVDAYVKDAKEKLIKLMNLHFGKAVNTVDKKLFHCLSPEVKVIAYWQTAVTRAVLVEEKQEEWPYMEVYVHAEPAKQ